MTTHAHTHHDKKDDKDDVKHPHAHHDKDDVKKDDVKETKKATDCGNWKKGPLPTVDDKGDPLPDDQLTWNWGGVVPVGCKEGFYFADFKGTHVCVCPGGRELKAEEVAWYNNSLDLPPEYDEDEHKEVKEAHLKKEKEIKEVHKAAAKTEKAEAKAALPKGKRCGHY